MPRTSRTALLRTLSTAATSLVLLVLTALPALAAAGTKPDADEQYLIGSLEQLVPTAVVGVVVAVIAWVLLPSRKDVAEDDHH